MPSLTDGQIDVLVALAAYGPDDRARWKRMVFSDGIPPKRETPTSLGRLLLEVAGYSRSDDYLFEPLGFKPTVEEALQAIAFYDMEFATTERYLYTWQGRLMAKLREQVCEPYVPRRAGPWPWTREEIARQRERRAGGKRTGFAARWAASRRQPGPGRT